MSCCTSSSELLIDFEHLSAGEREELQKLGLLTVAGQISEYAPPAAAAGHYVPRRAICAPEVLNEAFSYDKPSSFSRGLRLDLGGVSVLLISGTASIDEQGQTIHIGDFNAQCWRTYRNIDTLLRSEQAGWHDIVRTTCYLRDIERDYDAFNRIRTSFFRWLKLDPLPASVGIQARLCRSELLVEIEAVALLRSSA